MVLTLISLLGSSGSGLVDLVTNVVGGVPSQMVSMRATVGHSKEWAYLTDSIFKVRKRSYL